MKKSQRLMHKIKHVLLPDRLIQFINSNQEKIDFYFTEDNGNTFAHECFMAIHVSFMVSETYVYSENDLLKIFPFLLRNEEHIHKKNHEGNTLLDIAADKFYFDVIKFLLEKGAKISECKDPPKIMTRFKIAILNKKENLSHKEQLQPLVNTIEMIKAQLKENPLETEKQLHIDQMIEDIYKMIAAPKDETKQILVQLSKLPGVVHVSPKTGISANRQSIELKSVRVKFENSEYVKRISDLLEGFEGVYFNYKYLDILGANFKEVASKILNNPVSLIENVNEPTGIREVYTCSMFKSGNPTTNTKIESQKETTNEKEEFARAFLIPIDLIQEIKSNFIGELVVSFSDQGVEEAKKLSGILAREGVKNDFRSPFRDQFLSTSPRIEINKSSVEKLHTLIKASNVNQSFTI